MSEPCSARMRVAASRVSGSRPRRSRHGPTLSASRNTAASAAAAGSGWASTPWACARSATIAPAPTLVPITSRRRVAGSPRVGKRGAVAVSSSAAASAMYAARCSSSPRSRAPIPPHRATAAQRARRRPRPTEGLSARRPRPATVPIAPSEMAIACHVPMTATETARNRERDAAGTPARQRRRREAQRAAVEKLARHATCSSRTRDSTGGVVETAGWGSLRSAAGGRERGRTARVPSCRAHGGEPRPHEPERGLPRERRPRLLDDPLLQGDERDQERGEQGRAHDRSAHPASLARPRDVGDRCERRRVHEHHRQQRYVVSTAVRTQRQHEREVRAGEVAQQVEPAVRREHGHDAGQHASRRLRAASLDHSLRRLVREPAQGPVEAVCPQAPRVAASGQVELHRNASAAKRVRRPGRWPSRHDRDARRTGRSGSRRARPAQRGQVRSRAPRTGGSATRCGRRWPGSGGSRRSSPRRPRTRAARADRR